MSGEKHALGFCSSVETSLLAMAAREPTNLRQIHVITVGAAEGCDLLICGSSTEDQKIAASLLSTAPTVKWQAKENPRQTRSLSGVSFAWKNQAPRDA
ncbi:hypothetical protein [Pseudomonas sp. 13B_3.2_Bac1]|uniref:hypothetical protein n=1 Tax=Pseudomonas sp. 13B_3.2_Bac1 TaxID=2971623 RepID=UPI0021C708F7|nr:hypothetical protein [Pseudomonas sp. 13B_3.2_Bac1]MCU1773559.1 hypothetical protein [Pseudomonas sp. 13B_3.2_Bac1]